MSPQGHTRQTNPKQRPSRHQAPHSATCQSEDSFLNLHPLRVSSRAVQGLVLLAQGALWIQEIPYVLHSKRSHATVKPKIPLRLQLKARPGQMNKYIKRKNRGQDAEGGDAADESAAPADQGCRWQDDGCRLVGAVRCLGAASALPGPSS